MSDGYWFQQRYDAAEFAMTEGMTSPVRCRHCRRVYDLGKVEVVARYTDCSMWHCPGCKILADDRKPPWGIQHYDELPRRDHFFPVADEDEDFADPDGGTGLDSWDWPPPPGRRPPLCYAEEQADIINATGA